MGGGYQLNVPAPGAAAGGVQAKGAQVAAKEPEEAGKRGGAAMHGAAGDSSVVTGQQQGLTAETSGALHATTAASLQGPSAPAAAAPLSAHASVLPRAAGPPERRGLAGPLTPQRAPLPPSVTTPSRPVPPAGAPAAPHLFGEPYAGHEEEQLGTELLAAEEPRWEGAAASGARCSVHFVLRGFCCTVAVQCCAHAVRSGNCVGGGSAALPPNAGCQLRFWEHAGHGLKGGIWRSITAAAPAST